MTTKIEDHVKKALAEALSKRRKVLSTPPEHVSIEDFMDTEDSKPMEVTSTTTVELKSNQELFSSVIGQLPMVGDFPVTVFKTSDWDERVVGFIPDVQEEYVIDDVRAKDVLMAWELNEKVLCFGPTGSGKSSLIEQLCARTNRPFIRVNCTGDMDSSMIFGQLVAKDGSTHWEDGPVTEAVKYGAVFAWDEWDVTPPEIAMGLQWLLEDNGKLFLKEMPGSSSDRMIVPHKDFRLVALGNTQGQGDDTGAHAGTNVQNSATLDRFGTAVYVDYLPSEVEENMLCAKHSKLTKKLAKELTKLANLVRQGYKAGQLSLTMSPRSLFSICRKLDAGLDLKKAFASVYLNKLSDVQNKVAGEFYSKVFSNQNVMLSGKDAVYF